MDRLPLDYPYLFLKWRHKVSQFEDAITSNLPAELDHIIVSTKIELINKIISNHPDQSNCHGCGECCKEFPFACHLVEFIFLINYIAYEWDEKQQSKLFIELMGKVNYDGTNICPFLYHNKCSIYPARPLLCRRAICGDSICNKFSIQGESFSGWVNSNAGITQLTTMNLVYYYIDDSNKSVPVGWPINLNNCRGTLAVAPFEFWILLLLNEVDTCNQLFKLEYYKPLKRIFE